MISQIKKSTKQTLQETLDLIPPKKRKQIKLLLHRSVEPYSSIQRSYPWICKKGNRFSSECTPDTMKPFLSNLNETNPNTNVSTSYQNTMAIQEILKQKHYSFDTMLILLNPFGISPLTALAVFCTDTPCKVRFTIKGIKGNTEETTVSETTPTLETEHQVPIWGLYANYRNPVEMELLDENNQVLEHCTVFIKTASLSKDLQNTISVRKKTQTPSNPFTLITGGVNIPACAFDSAGEIRWYLSQKAKTYGIFLLSDNRFLFSVKNIARPTFGNPHCNKILEMDFLGRIFHTYYIPKGIHHNVIEKSNGNILSCASSLDDTYLENAVVEIDRKTGKVVKELNLNSCFDDTYKDSLDWAHINSLSFDEKEQTLVVSLRNLHSIVKIDWNTSEIIWIMANPLFWEGTAMKDKVLTPIGDIKWFYQQHAILDTTSDVHEKGHYDFLLFDNHWHKRRSVSFFDKDTASYITTFHVDENNKTVSMTSKTPCPKSTIRSNGILYPEHNRVMAMCGALEHNIDDYGGLVSEIDYRTSKSLNEYLIKPGFFAAYPLSIDYNELTKPLEFTSRQILGELESPEKLDCYPEEINQASTIIENITETNLEYAIEHNVLHVKALDHHVQSVYLIGKQHYYKKDFSDTTQKYEVFKTSVYSVLIPFEKLEKDRYNIYINYQGTLIKSKYWIKLG